MRTPQVLHGTRQKSMMTTMLLLVGRMVKRLLATDARYW
jgi:hypothetical protein